MELEAILVSVGDSARAYALGACCEVLAVCALAGILFYALWKEKKEMEFHREKSIKDFATTIINLRKEEKI